MTFKTGESGNIKGRPKGIKDRRTAFREMVEPRAQELIEKAVNLALEGNEQMLKLLLERLLPAKPKDEPVMVNLCSGDLRELVSHTGRALNGIPAVQAQSRRCDSKFFRDSPCVQKLLLTRNFLPQ